MSIPCSLRSRSFVTARERCAASSHSSAVFSISGLNTKMCSCIRVRPSRAPVDRTSHGVDLGHRLPLPAPRPADAGRRSGGAVVQGRGVVKRCHSSVTAGSASASNRACSDGLVPNRGSSPHARVPPAEHTRRPRQDPIAAAHAHAGGDRRGHGRDGRLGGRGGSRPSRCRRGALDGLGVLLVGVDRLHEDPDLLGSAAQRTRPIPARLGTPALHPRHRPAHRRAVPRRPR